MPDNIIDICLTGGFRAAGMGNRVLYQDDVAGVIGNQIIRTIAVTAPRSMPRAR